MGMKINTESIMVWDQDHFKLRKKIKVELSIVTNLGNLVFDPEPIYIENYSEFQEAKDCLIRRYVKKTSTL